MKSLELFVGAGGLALGTARAGFKHEAVVECEKNPLETLYLNKEAGVPHVRNWEIIPNRVEDVDFRRFRGHVDFIAGGPPCQPFSLGGKHKGVNDSRNMFAEAARAVREVRPQAFIFENVKGLLRQRWSNYYNYIIRSLKFPTVTSKGDEDWEDHNARLEEVETQDNFRGLQYRVIYQLLNAANYGIPQKRERVLIVGIRTGAGADFSFPHETHSEDALLYDKWVTGDYWEEHRFARKNRPEMPDRIKSRVARLQHAFRPMLGKRWHTVRDAIGDLPRIREGQTSQQIPNHFFNPGARSYKGHTGSPMDEPAKTLKAGDHGVPGGENTLRLDTGAVRYFSVRECARLQSFPDDWVFAGSWTESMRQLGNAVPLSLAETVARTLHEHLPVSDNVTRHSEAAK